MANKPDNRHRMKPMLPSLKEKKRYIAFEVISDKPLTAFNSVSRAIWDSVLTFVGESGAAKAGLWMLPEKWDSKKQRGIIRVSNKSVDEIKAAFALIKTIEKQDVIVRSLGISGMITTAEKNYIQSD